MIEKCADGSGIVIEAKIRRFVTYVFKKKWKSSKLDREKIVLNLNQGITFEMTKTILYLYGRKFYAKLLNL